MMCSAVRNRKRLAGMLICLIPIAACLLLTKSRSGYIAAGVGLLWCGCYRASEGSASAGNCPPRGRVAVLLVAAAAMVERTRRECSPERRNRSATALQYWQSSLRMIADHPWLGCGPGNFQDAYTQYKLPEASEEIADPHNFLLEIWATAGTPAALALSGRVGLFCVGAWRGQRVGGRGSGESPEELQNPKLRLQSRRPSSPVPQSPDPQSARRLAARSRRRGDRIPAVGAVGMLERRAAGR